MGAHSIKQIKSNSAVSPSERAFADLCFPWAVKKLDDKAIATASADALLACLDEDRRRLSVVLSAAAALALAKNGQIVSYRHQTGTLRSLNTEKSLGGTVLPRHWLERSASPLPLVLAVKDRHIPSHTLASQLSPRAQNSRRPPPIHDLRGSRITPKTSDRIFAPYNLKN